MRCFVARSVTGSREGSRRSRLRAGLLCVMLAGAMGAGAWGEVFTFDTNTQGWKVFNMSFVGQFISNPQPVGDPMFDGANGLPAGSLRVTDQTGETWIGSPPSVNGDRSSLYGSTISYDIRYRFRDVASYAAVALAGPAFTLVLSTPPPDLDVWLHRSFPLVPGEWRINTISGELASEAQIREVLADFRGVFIHTEWNTGPDDTSVDNVRLGASCPGDTNGDNVVDFVDLNVVLSSFGLASGQAGFIPGADLNNDGAVDFLDLNLLLSFFGTAC